jgi:hypothetical protein
MSLSELYITTVIAALVWPVCSWSIPLTASLFYPPKFPLCVLIKLKAQEVYVYDKAGGSKKIMRTDTPNRFDVYNAMPKT